MMPVASSANAASLIKMCFSWKYKFPERTLQRTALERLAAVMTEGAASRYAKLPIAKPIPPTKD